MKIISLFSGAGGLDLGLIQAGNTVIWDNAVSYTHLTLPTNREVYLSVVAVLLKNRTTPIYSLGCESQGEYGV